MVTYRLRCLAPTYAQSDTCCRQQNGPNLSREHFANIFLPSCAVASLSLAYGNGFCGNGFSRNSQRGRLPSPNRVHCPGFITMRRTAGIGFQTMLCNPSRSNSRTLVRTRFSPDKGVEKDAKAWSLPRPRPLYLLHDPRTPLQPNRHDPRHPAQPHHRCCQLRHTTPERVVHVPIRPVLYLGTCPPLVGIPCDEKRTILPPWVQLA